MNRTLDFFSQQFEKQIATKDYHLNSFEQLALAYVRGRVLDLGGGLGNFSLAAARAGHKVTAIDACENAVADLQSRADAENLCVHALQSDLFSVDSVTVMGL